MDPGNLPSPSGISTYAAEIIAVVAASFGGIAKYLDFYIRTGEMPTFGKLLAHAVVSGFSGYMFAQVVVKFHPEWMTVAAGIGGYLGTQGLDFVADVIKKRVFLTGGGGKDDTGK